MKGGGLRVDIAFDPYRHGSLDDLRQCITTTVALNCLSRSLGQPDLYPFVLSKPVVEKLGFIHDLARNAARHGEQRAA